MTVTAVFSGITIQFLFFAAGLGLLYNVEVILRRQERFNLLLFAVFMLNAVFYISFGLYLKGVGYEIPDLMVLLLPCILAMGPVNYIYFRKTVGSFKPPAWPHLVPALFALMACLTGAFYFTADAKRDFLLAMSNDPLSHQASLAVVAAGLHAAAYFTWLLAAEWRLFSGSGPERRGEVRIILVVTVLAVTSSAFLLAGFLLSSLTLMVIGSLLTCGDAIIFFMGSNIHGEFFGKIALEYRKQKYEKSRLAGLDTDALLARLNDLFEVEQIFLDYDLSLEETARRLDVSVPGLSQLVNQHMKTDFRNMVNRYRIDLACKTLAADPDAGISRVAYMCGFNSKTAFNRAFKKFTGQSPSEYRLSCAGKTSRPSRMSRQS